MDLNVECNNEVFEPLVSIIIPVYNGSNYLKEAIDSALAQTYKHIEIIVVNDGSDDGGATEAVIDSYGSRVRCIHKVNGGVSSALNAGIKEMQGEYFSWLSHDDVYDAQKVSKQVELLATLEDKRTVIKCATEYIDAYSRPLTIRKGKTRVKYNTVIPWDEALNDMFANGQYNGCTLLIHKTIFDVCGGFDERLRFNQDGFMWMRFFLNGFSVCFSSYIGVKSRMHNEQLTRKNVNLFHSDCEKMCEYLLPRFIEHTNKTRRFVYEYAKDNAKYQNYAVVKKALSISDRDVLTTSERVIIRFYMLYGYVRSWARAIYYRLIKRIRVKGEAH